MYQTEVESKKRELEEKKKTIELEAEAIGKEYERIYQDTIERAKNTFSRYQNIEIELQNKIDGHRAELEAASGGFQQEATTNKGLQETFQMHQSRNNALLLYANHLQEAVEKI